MQCNNFFRYLLFVLLFSFTQLFIINVPGKQFTILSSFSIKEKFKSTYSSETDKTEFISCKRLAELSQYLRLCKR